MDGTGKGRRAATAALLATLASGSGCYHFSFEQMSASTAMPAPPSTITYVQRVPTYLNGFIGTGRVDAARYCAEPVRTELRVTATDVLLSMVTLLIYTPHTLSVTCPAVPTVARRL
jgi:hypothetical protein